MKKQLTNTTIYLDYAAATPVDELVLEAMQPYFIKYFYNPSADYLLAGNVNKDLNLARSAIAEVLGSKPSEIIFTAGATEANNLAIRGILESYPGTNLIYSAIEHDSVIEPSKLYQTKILPVNSEGIVSVDELTHLIDDKTVLVSVMYANNEVGTIQPIDEISKIIKSILEKRISNNNLLPLYLHCDAAQAGNYLDLHVSRLGVDLMSLNGGKIYGPKQSGALFIKTGVNIKPQILGGGQEMGYRSGTENVASSIGFAKALQISQQIRGAETIRLKQLQTIFINHLNKALPDGIINGSIKHRLVNNVHVTLPGKDNERILMLLDEAGIMSAAGSACSASNDEPSHVLKSMGISEVDAQSSIRFTMGRKTTESDIRKVVEVLASLPI